MRVSQITEIIEQTANPCFQAEWDKSGMQVASAREEAACVAVFLDPLASQVKKAIDSGAQYLLCHHPLSLSPGLPNRLDNYHEVIRLALCAGVPLYAAHTSLDVNPEGPAGWFGRALGLSGCGVIEPLPDHMLAPGYGYGGIGNLSAPLSFESAIKDILSLLKPGHAVAAGPKLAGMCKKIAWCGGSGGSLISAAEKLGADIYVTGDITYHKALDAGLPVLDVGHHALEEEMMRRFAEDLGRQLSGVEVVFLPSVSPFRII